MVDFLCIDWDQDDWATDCVNGDDGGQDENRTGAIRKPPRSR